MEIAGWSILLGEFTDFKIFPLSKSNKDNILNKKQNVLFVLQLLISFLYDFSIDYVNICLFSILFLSIFYTVEMSGVTPPCLYGDSLTLKLFNKYL